MFLYEKRGSCCPSEHRLTITSSHLWTVLDNRSLFQIRKVCLSHSLEGKGEAGLVSNYSFLLKSLKQTFKNPFEPVY